MSEIPRTPLDDIDLMAYVDGEADQRAAGAIAAQLAGDMDARTKTEALGQMTDLVRSYLELTADDVEPRLDDMWTTIERRIQANGVPRAAEPAAAEVARAMPGRAMPARKGPWARLGEWLDARRGYLATGLVAAAAAAVLVMALRPPQIIERVVVAPTPSTDLVKPAVNVSTPPEVEVIEVSDGAASVFTLPGEGGDDVTAGVIWLNLDESDMEGPL